MSVRWVVTDAMWDRIESMMPADPVRGRRWADHPRTLEAIARKYRTCSPWRDLPDELGSFHTAHQRLSGRAGTWEDAEDMGGTKVGRHPGGAPRMPPLAGAGAARRR
ncbi:transposase [Streptomyces longwoodensis]|nr:transposase [Streptomyces longwoodensis]WRY88548.1 transposase [Streptomyces longwoodensis]